MKKLLLWTAAWLFGFSTAGQDNKSAPEKKSFLAFSAGLSIPIVCYGSTDINNKNAGYAKIGFTLDLSYGYRFGKNLGVTGSAFYSSNKTDKTVLDGAQGSYRYYGVVAGPLLTKNLSSKAGIDFKYMAGFAHVIAPKLLRGGETLLEKASANAFAWTAGVGLRYGLGDNTFFSFKVDHSQMKPQFHSSAQGENAKTEQHIVVINIDAGIGIKF